MLLFLMNCNQIRQIFTSIQLYYLPSRYYHHFVKREQILLYNTQIQHLLLSVGRKLSLGKTINPVKARSFFSSIIKIIIIFYYLHTIMTSLNFRHYNAQLSDLSMFLNVNNQKLSLSIQILPNLKDLK